MSYVEPQPTQDLYASLTMSYIEKALDCWQYRITSFEEMELREVRNPQVWKEAVKLARGEFKNEIISLGMKMESRLDDGDFEDPESPASS